MYASAAGRFHVKDAKYLKYVWMRIFTNYGSQASHPASHQGGERDSAVVQHRLNPKPQQKAIAIVESTYSECS